MCTGDAQRGQAFIDEHEQMCTGASVCTSPADFYKTDIGARLDLLGSRQLPERLVCSARVSALYLCTDIVYVGSYNNRHKEHAVEALNAGKHVLCEKPLAMDPEEVKEIVDAAKKNKRFFMEVCQGGWRAVCAESRSFKSDLQAIWSRFFPIYTELRDALDKKLIGEAKSVYADFGCGCIPDVRCAEIRRVPKLA